MDGNKERYIDAAKLYKVMSERRLCDYAVDHFGMEYLRCAPDMASTPHEMDELDDRVGAMGLPTEELSRMLTQSKRYGSSQPFNFKAKYFCGDKDGLVSIETDDILSFTYEAIGGECMEDFIEWCVNYGFISEKWLREGGSELSALLDEPIWNYYQACGPDDEGQPGQAGETDEYINLTNKLKEMEENKNINPAHYGAGGKHECIDVMTQQFGLEKVMTFCQLNAFKYLFRMDGKGRPAEDAAKARWYLRRYERLRRAKEDEARLLGDVKTAIVGDGKGGEA